MTDHRDYPARTCPGRPACTFTHCRKCGECPIVNGFGLFGHCAKCIKAPEDYRDAS